MNRGSIRRRIVWISSLAVLAGGVVLGLLVLVLISQVYTRSTDAVLSSRVGDVVVQLSEHSVDLNDPPDIGSSDYFGEVYSQLVNARGAVLSSSVSLPAGMTLCPTPLPVATVFSTSTLTIGKVTETVRRMVTPVTRSGTTVFVCAVVNTKAWQRAEDAVRIAIAVIIPLVTIVTALVAAYGVRRALTSVESLRQQAAALSSLDSGGLVVLPSGDEIERLGQTLNDMLDRLHRSSAATRQFVADAGHEIRSPLATMRATLEFTLDAGEEELRIAARDVLTDLDRLERLVDDLLLLARTDAKAPVERRPINLDEIVVEEAARAQRRFPHVTVEHSADPVTVLAEPRRLRRAITNICDNAGRHATTTVRIRLRQASDGAVITVDDDGPGIPSERISEVFERFVRLDEARIRDAGGSGLGLPIAVSIITELGGTVVANPGPGGHIIVTVPISCS